MRAVLIALCLLAAPVHAEDRLVRLHAPDILLQSGLFKFIVPRFSLKTQVKVEIVADPGAADLVIGGEGAPLFSGFEQNFYMDVARDTPAGARFVAWLSSDVGKRTVYGYAPEGVALFEEMAASAPVVAEVSLDGDAVAGHEVARAMCARCHAVDEDTRMSTIGSTPSFFVLRAFEDWENRFGAFYVLAPHPAFTQIEDVTEPFAKERPSPIVPIEMTLEDVEAVLAYVGQLAAADLGAPLQHQ